ncbi:MAG TPA: DNA-protecting protein DprA [Bacteroidales bacterium]|jgi:DNA processing protein|nr:DNA-protecting protein DprA [Bacteroidales bacterium]
MSLLYEIALTLIPGIGDINGKKLVNYCGSAEAVFKEKKSALMRIPGIGEHTANAIINAKPFDRAQQEIEFIEKFNIKVLYFKDKDYPLRLRNCEDGPLLIYYKGSESLNPPLSLSIVGTRRATDYGKWYIDKLMEALSPYAVVIVSGLAFGIDTAAHRSALEHGLPTIAVLGHGLDRIYPGQNRQLAKRMLNHGGLLSDFPSQTNPDRENFPKRNRIIAGLCDALLVIETGIKGGSLITADIANSYNRDVFALPGRFGDIMSEGCNWLIRTNRASLLDSPETLLKELGWLKEGNVPQVAQSKLFIEYTEDEKKIIEILNRNTKAGIDKICIESQLPSTKVAAALLNLEFQGIVKCLPGKIYQLI